MLFYILLIMIVTGLSVISSFFLEKKVKTDLIIITILFLVAAFRYRVGGDYDSYVYWYINKNRDDDFEIGFLVIMNLLRSLDLGPFFLFFFFSFFTYFFLFLGIKKYTKSTDIALLFYLLIPSMYLTSFMLIRQSFSVAISFYGFYYLINRKYLFFSILMLIGISIHRSCILVFFIFLIVYKFGEIINKKYLFLLLLLSFIISRFDLIQFFKIFFKNTRYVYYFPEQITQVSTFKIIILNIVGLVVLFYYDKLVQNFLNYRYLIFLYFFSIIFINLFSRNYDLTRIYTYFKIFEIIIIADLICLVNNQKKIALFSFFYILYFGAFLNALKVDYEINSEEFPRYIPYKNVFMDKPN